jgi:beta-galactosidase
MNGEQPEPPGRESRRVAGQHAPVSRRVFLRTATAGTAGIAAWSMLSARPAAAASPERASRAGASADGQQVPGTVRRGPASETISFNAGWLFGSFADGSDEPGYDDSALATVTLPHTVAPLSWQDWNPASWEQTWVYRKHFDAPAGTDGLRLFLDFQAAMTQSTVTLNGSVISTYAGGYLPFSAEVTGLLQPTDNVVAVTLNSSFNIDVPPDRPAPDPSTDVDYWQPGGIYRDVQFRAVPQIFLSDVFARPVNVLDPASRQVVVQATVDAGMVPADAATVTVELLDADAGPGARPLATASAPVVITETGETTVTVSLQGIPAVTLWDPETPKLYTVSTTLSVGDTQLHDYQTRVGFREAVFRLDGFYLNGNRVKLFGLNRHQFFPYAGGAMPDRVQSRDAYILRKELNCNAVRCSHYPQSEAFYDAADELGLMVWEEMPGWGYFGDGAWQAAAYQNLHDMIIRDRNHPSVIIWGAMPNEAGEYPAEYTLYNDLAHSLDPSRQTGGDDPSPADATYVFDVFSRHDYSSVTSSDGIREPTLAAPTDAASKPYLVCEAIGTLSGPAIYYRRFDTQAVQQGQAQAHAIVHNISYSDDAYCGLLAWSGFDYPSGNGNEYQGVKYTGVVDLFRVLKPGAAIYQAQADPATAPVIAPAFYWDFGLTSPVTSLSAALICSNLDSLEVYVGGELLTTVTPDTAGFGSLPHAPSWVDFTSVDASTLPELRIDGYLNGAKVASRRFDGDPSNDRLLIEADDLEINADGTDATRVALRAADQYGNARPYVDGPVALSVEGPAVLIGDNPLDFGATGGTGAAWIRSLPGSPGLITLRASHPTLGEATARIRVAQVPEAGAPVPYGALAVSASPALVAPGTTTTVTATLTNNGLLELDTAALTVTLPAGWTVTAQAPVPFDRVRRGATVTAAWQVTLPSDADPGQASIQVEAVYTAGRQRGVSYARVDVLSVYATLAAAFNNTGISDDSDIAGADFDGVGNSYSTQALTAAGLAAGATITHDGITFTWPDIQPGQPDNVVAQGQTILLSGSGTTLGVIGAGSPASESGSGTVYYTDGTTSSFSITLDNYFDAPVANDLIAQLPYINDTNPATAGDGGKAGQRKQTAYVFYTSAPLTAGKTVQGITLPAGGTIPASGRISGMHIFALGTGPLNAMGEPLS